MFYRFIIVLFYPIRIDRNT